MPPKKRVGPSYAELLVLMKKQNKLIEDMKKNLDILKQNQANEANSEPDSHMSKLRNHTYQPTAFQRFLELESEIKFVHVVDFLNVYEMANLDIALALTEYREEFLECLNGTRILGVENSILPSFACLEWCYKRGIEIHHIKQSFVQTMQDDDDLGMDDDRVEVEEKTLIYVAYNKRLKDKISVDFFKYILRAVDLNVRLPSQHHSYTPLILATVNDYCDTTEFLLDRMEKESKGNKYMFSRFANAKDDFGDTALMKAAGDLDNTKIVKLLVDSGVDIDETNNQNFSALIMATECGNKRMAKILIKAGADIEIGTKNGVAADTAIQATMEFKKKNGGDRALHLAACNGYEEIVLQLIKNDVEIDATTQMGWTSLMFAAHEGHVKIVKLLLEHGADATLRTFDIKDKEEKYKMQCMTAIEIVEMKNENTMKKIKRDQKEKKTPEKKKLDKKQEAKLENDNRNRDEILTLLRAAVERH